MYEYLGVWLSWESACFACKRSGVRIPSSPPVGKPDSIKSSIVKSGFLLFLRLKNLFYSTQADKNPHCSRKWLK